nr:MAG TPA: hypothetical protein [Caudoviricetes sp.]
MQNGNNIFQENRKSLKQLLTNDVSLILCPW